MNNKFPNPHTSLVSEKDWERRTEEKVKTIKEYKLPYST